MRRRAASTDATYAVFSTSMSMTALSMMVRRLFCRRSPSERHDWVQVCFAAIFEKIAAFAPRVGLAALMFGIAAALGLILLACFKTTEFPDTHLYSAYGFFSCLTVHASCNTFVFSRNVAWRRSYCVKLIINVAYCIAFLIYIPIGLAVICPFERLSMADCLGKEGLPPQYCAAHVRAQNSSQTVFWDYSHCPSTNMMRTVTQSLSVLCLLLYCLTYAHDLSATEELKVRDHSETDGLIARSLHGAF